MPRRSATASLASARFVSLSRKAGPNATVVKMRGMAASPAATTTMLEADSRRTIKVRSWLRRPDRR